MYIMEGHILRHFSGTSVSNVIYFIRNSLTAQFYHFSTVIRHRYPHILKQW